LKKVPYKDAERDDFVLFSESNSRFLIEVAPQDRELFEKLMGKYSALIGKVSKQPKLIIRGLRGKVVVEATVDKLRYSWKKTLNPQEASQ
jgi:phosphoribosylformylglycinamidine synthase